MSYNNLIKLARKLQLKIASYPKEYKKEVSQGDGYKITLYDGQAYLGYIDYRPVDQYGDKINEIWWVESKRPGTGAKLVDLMMKEDPAESIAWGVTSVEGKHLMESYHRKHPEINCITGALEGQFNPFPEQEYFGGGEDEEDFEDEEGDSFDMSDMGDV